MQQIDLCENFMINFPEIMKEYKWCINFLMQYCYSPLKNDNLW